MTIRENDLHIDVLGHPLNDSVRFRQACAAAKYKRQVLELKGKQRVQYLCYVNVFLNDGGC